MLAVSQRFSGTSLVKHTGQAKLINPLNSIKQQNSFNISFDKSNTSTKKSRIRETKNLSTDADSRTDTILERLRDLSK